MKRVISDKYEIVKEIASGGMGTVYKAIQLNLGRVVAIKALLPQYASDPTFLKRFYREAKSMAKLEHPNIISIYDVLNDGDLHYIAMEFVEGKDIRTLLLERGHFSIKDTLKTAKELASALDCAHRNSVIHRDIKPGNIIITQNNTAKIGDFGLAAAADEATITTTGQVLGTPEYMSPQQAKGLPIDAQMDLYSLGVLIYKIVTGNTPFDGLTKVSIIGKLITDQIDFNFPFSENLPQGLRKIILRLVGAYPDDMYSTARQLELDIEALMMETALLKHKEPDRDHEEEEATRFFEVTSHSGNISSVSEVSSLGDQDDGKTEVISKDTPKSALTDRLSTPAAISESYSTSGAEPSYTKQPEPGTAPWAGMPENKEGQPSQTINAQNNTKASRISGIQPQNILQTSPKKNISPKLAIGILSVIVILSAVTGIGWYLKKGSLIAQHTAAIDGSRIKREAAHNKMNTFLGQEGANLIKTDKARESLGMADRLFQESITSFDKEDYHKSIQKAEEAFEKYTASTKLLEKAEAELKQLHNSLKAELAKLKSEVDLTRKNADESNAKDSAAETWRKARQAYETAELSLKEEMFSKAQKAYKNAMQLYASAETQAKQKAADIAKQQEAILQARLMSESSRQKMLLAKEKSGLRKDSKAYIQAVNLEKKAESAYLDKNYTEAGRLYTSATKKFSTSQADLPPSPPDNKSFIKNVETTLKDFKTYYESKDMEGLKSISIISAKTENITLRLFKNYKEIQVKFEDFSVVRQAGRYSASATMRITSLTDYYDNKAIPSKTWDKSPIKIVETKDGKQVVKW